MSSAIGYGSRVTIQNNRKILPIVTAVEATPSSTSVVTGTTVFFKALMEWLRDDGIHYMDIGYYKQAEQSGQNVFTSILQTGPVGRSGTPEILIGDTNFNGGRPTIRFKFNILSGTVNIDKAPSNIFLVLRHDKNINNPEEDIWFEINTESTEFTTVTGESQIITWEIYFQSGSVSESSGE